MVVKTTGVFVVVKTTGAVATTAAVVTTVVVGVLTTKVATTGHRRDGGGRARTRTNLCRQGLGSLRPPRFSLLFADKHPKKANVYHKNS